MCVVDTCVLHAYIIVNAFQEHNIFYTTCIRLYASIPDDDFFVKRTTWALNMMTIMAMVILLDNIGFIG